MAVNPKLILLAAETLSSEEGRNRVLQIVLYALGVVLMIVVVFAGLISGLLGVIQNSNLQRHWNYVRSSITELFDGMENDINTDVKNEVYDFMPDFSINLSKATIGNKFDGNSLILYDEEEIAAAEYVMLQFARQLRSITNETDFNAFMADYPDDTLEYTDIIKIQFTDDTGIDNIDKYEENLQRFLFMRASEQLSQYTYTYEEVRIDGKPAEVQTLVVLDNAGDTQTVEYTCIGGGEIYIPQFLAMFSVYQSREFLLSNTLSDESLEVQFEEIVGEIPVTAEAAEAYFEESWKSVVDGKGAINLGVFETSNLCKIIEEANLDGAVKIDVERTKDKLSITLETAGSDIWAEIFGVTGDLEKYVTETQYAIEMALDEVGVPVAERTLSLDNMVQAALFVYFEGFFELPVDSPELASGSNGILSQYGDVSDIHEYNYGSIANDYGLPERGITLHLENADTEIHADLLNCDDSVITEAFIYDVWNAEEHELDRANMPSAIQNPANKIFNRSAVTIAYIIDTGEFEKVYGFPFPKINNYYPDGDTVTLLLEFTCLDRLNGIVELDKGRDIEELFGSRDNVVIGYCHNGYYDSEYDKSGDEMGYYHTMRSDECIPHICVKTFFYTGSVSRPTVEANDIPSYNGPSTISDSSTTAMRVNPRLWFKGFRTGMSEELFETLSAIQP